MKLALVALCLLFVVRFGKADERHNVAVPRVDVWGCGKPIVDLAQNKALRLLKDMPAELVGQRIVVSHWSNSEKATFLSALLERNSEGLFTFAYGVPYTISFDSVRQTFVVFETRLSYVIFAEDYELASLAEIQINDLYSLAHKQKIRLDEAATRKKFTGMAERRGSFRGGTGARVFDPK